MAKVAPIDESLLPPLPDADTVKDNLVAQLAAQHLPIVLPWGKRKVALGTCYNSKRQDTEDPFMPDSPFILSDLYTTQKYLNREVGTDSQFKSLTTSKVVETGDHLSLGLGAGVGLPFLAEVSVKGQFDQHVHKNNDSNKVSIRAGVRCGSVMLDRNPRLSREAAIVIKHEGGYQSFCDKYGDYFVAGYRLGGDTGLLISTSSFKKVKIDQYSVTVTVEVLFLEHSETYSKDFREASEGRSFSLLGYDTLDRKNWNMKSSAEGIGAMQDQSQDIMLRSQCILERTLDKLDELGLKGGHSLTHAQCDALVESGAVVELFLLPMTALRDVQRWSLNDNII